MRRILLLTTLLLHIALVSAGAQTSQGLRTFTVRDGLPANAITAIHQDVKGLIWIATWNGLCCYDGYRFSSFRGDPWGSRNSLSSNRISAIKPDSKGNIWVITYDSGLYFFDTERCQFFDVKQMLQQEYGVSITPRNIYSAPNGHTWITDASEQMNLRIDDGNPLDVKSMERWGTKGQALKGAFLRKVEIDSKGREWIVTDEGMMRYGSKEFHKDVYTLADLSAQLVAKDPDSAIRQDAKEYVKANGIKKYCIDRQGNLWYPTQQGGLTLVNFSNYHMHQIALEANQETRAVLCRKDGSIWVGTKDGCLRVYRPNEGSKWVSPNGAIVNSRVPFSGYIYALYEDADGQVWVGTKGNGLYVIAADGKTVRHYTHSDSDTYSLSNDNIYDIHQDDKGNMWIATYGGGVNLVRGEKQFMHKGNEMKHYPKEDFLNIRRITHDQKGNIIASTTTGLMTFKAPQKASADLRFHTSRHLLEDTSSLWTNDVMQTLVTRSGQIYVITMGGGVQQVVSDNLQQDDLKFKIVEKMNQGAGNALSLTEDQQGHIWITRETEVNRYDVKKNTLEQFGPNSMEEPADMTEAQTILSPDGSMWIGTTGGLLTFKVQNMKKSTYQPNIIFSSIQYQGEQQERPLLNRQMLDVMEQAERDLTIRFAALDYENNYLMQYAYRMKEDKKGTWNYIGHIPRISFSNMSPGWHTIIVKSTNAGGMWCDNETEFTLYIQPMLWERLWFRIVVLLLVVGLLTWATISYTRYRKRHKEREKRLESIMRQYQELLNQQPTADSQQPAVKEYKLSEPEIVNPDEQMMTRLMAFIEERISDEELRIEDMADAVGMGRTVFYEKIRQLVGVSPSDFLRQVRMQRAQQLLAKSSMTISEIAYNIGFTDPKYFTKCFKKQTGVTPTEYREARS